MSNIRSIKGGNILSQGEDESIARKLDVSTVGSGATSPSVTVKDMTADGEDVTATVATGSASVDENDVITLPAIHSLTAGHEYRVEVQYTISGNVFETYFYIKAQV